MDPRKQPGTLTFLDALVLSGFLATAFQWRGILPIDIRLIYVIAIAILAGTTWLSGIAFNRQMIGLGLMVATTSSLAAAVGSTSPFRMVGQLAGIAVFSTGLFAYFRLNAHQLLQRLQWFFNLMYVLSVYAIVQEIAYLLGIEALYNINYLLPGVGVGPTNTEGPFLRVFSVFTEPGHFGIALTPAVYVAVNVLFFGRRYFLSRFQAVIVLLALLLTFSLAGYMGLVFAILAAAGPRRSIRLGLILGALLIVVTSLASGVQDRIITLFALFAGNADGLGNASAFIFYLNAKAAMASFLNNPLWGSGLGSHAASYTDYVAQTGLSDPVIRFLQYMPATEVNMGDGYSMYLRLPSELGLLGIGSVVYFLITNRVRAAVEPYPLLGEMCLVYILTYFVREGHYFRFELWYFVALYAHLRYASTLAITTIPTETNT